MTYRSRPGSRAAALLAAALAVPGAAAAQDSGVTLPVQNPVVEVPAPFLTIDQERLFAESAFGRRVGRELEERSNALAAENRRIEAELIDEEQALTDARPTLPPDEFRNRADAFDAKVQQIRAEQDAKAEALGRFRETEQQRFAGSIAGVLGDIARARGALAVMDRRQMLVSIDSIDITDEAVAALDAQLGDGTEPKK